MVKRFVDQLLGRFGKAQTAEAEPQYTAPTPEGRAAQPPEQKPPEQAPTIFSYQREIGLSDEQVQRMKARLQQLNDTVARNRELLAVLEGQCNALLLNEAASLVTIESRLNEIAQLVVSSQMEDLRCSREIMAMIEPAQLQRWREIQQAAQAAAAR